MTTPARVVSLDQFRGYTVAGMFLVNFVGSYLVHLWLNNFIKPFAPRDAPLWWVLVTFGIFFGATVGTVNWLNRRGLFLRL